jgi:hypothetical protein
LSALWILVAREAPIFAEVALWNREAGDLLEDRLPVLAPLYAVITVQLTIPHATAIMTTARIARRRSESTSRSPITRMLAKANTRAAKNGGSKLTTCYPPSAT